MGFILAPEEAQALIAKDPRNKDVLFPYLNGEDLNSRPDQSPSRWVINFHDWHFEQAKIYPDCIRILEEKVKPVRENASEKVLREKWWLYKRTTPALRAAISKMELVLVCPRVTKYSLFQFVQCDQVFSDKIYVFPFDKNQYLALLCSNIHEIWAREYSATLETRLQYAPTDCFETFPFPLNTDSLEDIGERYYTHRQSIMLTRQEGLTQTYNRFHDPYEHSAEIVKLRELHTEMDEAVAAAYGWQDLALEHGFHETKQGLRYTISEAARREVLDRLLLLNHQRHEEEVRAGLFDVKGKGTKAKKAKSVVNDGKAGMSDDGLEQGALF
jgi:hypothetical protein